MAFGVFGVDVCEVHSVCSIYEAFGLVDFCGVQSVCSVYGALGLDVCGVTAFVAFLGR